jgi:hypothetical protein
METGHPTRTPGHFGRIPPIMSYESRKYFVGVSGCFFTQTRRKLRKCPGVRFQPGGIVLLFKYIREEVLPHAGTRSAPATDRVSRRASIYPPKPDTRTLRQNSANYSKKQPDTVMRENCQSVRFPFRANPPQTLRVSGCPVPKPALADSAGSLRASQKSESAMRAPARARGREIQHIQTTRKLNASNQTPGAGPPAPLIDADARRPRPAGSGVFAPPWRKTPNSATAFLRHPRFAAFRNRACPCAML